MKVKNDYNNCLTNLACSVRKYFGLPIKHSSLADIDRILSEKRPRNVIVMLFDGMGANILDRTLSKDDFFLKNKLRSLYSVFPATTTAATTAMRTGLNPIEHGWLGWTMYFAPIDKTVTLFTDAEKGTENPCPEYLSEKSRLYQGTIVKDINTKGDDSAVELFPFGDNQYNGLDDMLARIKEETKKPGRHYIYAYDDQPDHDMHDLGVDSPKVKDLIRERNQKVAGLVTELEDAVVIVVADHGHLNTRNLFLEEHPEVLELLERTPSLEERAVVFKVKEGLKAEFRKRFESVYGKDFTLYDTTDVIDSHLFGDGDEHELFRPALGDFLAITETDACLVAPDDEVLASNHAGYHDDEIFVPLIVHAC